LIAEAVANMLVGYDYTNMESLAERIIRQPDVLRITIRNHDGKIMVTRDKSDAAAESRLDFGSPVIFSSKPVGTVELDLTLEHARSELKSNYRNIIIAQIFSGLFLGLLIYFAAIPVHCQTCPANQPAYESLTATRRSHTTGAAGNFQP